MNPSRIAALAAALLGPLALAAHAAPRGTYVEVDPSMAPSLDPTAVSTRLIYLNGCFGSGDCTVSYGRESPATNQSSIGRGTLDAFEYGAVAWDAVVECVRETYRPFDVEITDQDPGATKHWESMVGGVSTDIGMDGSVLGVSPWRNCEVLDQSITFTFANMSYYGGRVDRICSTIAQETAHSFGLEHEFLCGDPMTYLEECSDRKYFNNVDARCGEYSPQSCECGGATQNSFQMLTDLFGEGEVPVPTVTLQQPAEGAEVDAGFVINAIVGEDEVPLTGVEFFVNGELIETVAEEPFAISVPLDLADGRLKVEARATNVYGKTTSATVRVTQGEPCAEADDCNAGQTCVDGGCVLGPGQAGGLGEACVAHANCASGVCAASSEGSFCAAECELGAGGCPDDFGCLEVGDGGVCWRGYDDGEDGGCAAAGGAGALAWLGVGLALLGVRRRRA